MNQETTVYLTKTGLEVPCTRRGRLSYRWTTGYFVRKDGGNTEYPPLRRAEAFNRAYELGATRVVVVSNLRD
ncbi:hypothetical protein J7E62_24570 [Variovorax paradoxus]|nr:hypothetical protein [Variovorax paradoxus]